MADQSLPLSEHLLCGVCEGVGGEREIVDFLLGEVEAEAEFGPGRTKVT